MNLSRFFTLDELTFSNTARAEGIANQPQPAEVESLRALCTAVLDPLREAVGRPIKVTSGYRGPALNKRVNGATKSQHLNGQAADIQSPGMAVLELFKTVIRLGLPFDQLIYEVKGTSKWVHVSHNPVANAGEILLAKFTPDGRVSYPRVSAEQALAMSEPVSRSRGPEPSYVETADEPEREVMPVPAAAAGRKKAVVRKVAAKKPAAKTAPAKKAPAAKAAAKKAATALAPSSKRAAKTAVAKTPAAKTVPRATAAVKQAAANRAAPVKVAAAKGAVAPPRKAAAAKGLAQLVAKMAGSKTAKAVISGYHSASGQLAGNQELAKQRAFTVRDSLLDAGVPEARVVLQKPQQAAANLAGEDPAARRVDVAVK